MRENEFIKLIIAHFFISVITVFMTGLAMNNETYFIVTFISCLMYAISGYIITKQKIKSINYFGTAIIGIVLWVVCFINSPDSTNYKGNHEAGIWFFDKLYLIVMSPLNFIDFITEPYNRIRELTFLLFIPILLSCLQLIGGIYKVWEIKYDEDEKLKRHNNNNVG